MKRAMLSQMNCSTCRWYKAHGKPTGKCLSCSYAYTFEYKRKSSGRRKALKERRAMSDDRLATLYQRIKVKYFKDRYIPDSKFVLFTWRKGGRRRNACCWKGRKEMRFGTPYKDAFIRKSRNEEAGVLCYSDDYNDRIREDLVLIMIHESLHLRLAHHRKSFRRAEEYHKALFKKSHINELFEGLIRG